MWPIELHHFRRLSDVQGLSPMPLGMEVGLGPATLC